MLTEPLPAPVAPASVGELKAYLRIDTSDEDALLAGLIRGATAMAEAFLREWLVQRAAVETVPALATPPGARLSATPAGPVALVEALAPDGTATTLAAGQYALVSDSDCVLFISTAQPNAAMLRVTYQAGLAPDWNGTPEPVRHGIVRLAAYLFENRDSATDGGPPPVVAALWRPFRRLRLGAPACPPSPYQTVAGGACGF